MTDLTDLSLENQIEGLSSKKFSSVELTSSYLKKIEKQRPLSFGHGDLCFNNILIEPISGSIKLIDPKADSVENNKVGFVDPFYDLAKLNHSFKCFYDSIVNNMFSMWTN